MSLGQRAFSKFSTVESLELRIEDLRYLDLVLHRHPMAPLNKCHKDPSGNMLLMRNSSLLGCANVIDWQPPSVRA